LYIAGRHVTQICLLGLLVFALPMMLHAAVLNDAYVYEDDFGNNVGLDLTASSGITVSGGTVTADAASAVVVSKCFSLPQPEGGAFVGWEFLDLALADASSTSVLEVQDCSGTTLRTFPALPSGDSNHDLRGLNTPAIRLEWRPGQTGTRIDSWKLYGHSKGATRLEIIPENTPVNAGDTITFRINLFSSGQSPKVRCCVFHWM
jgi:hypothetical protein